MSSRKAPLTHSPDHLPTKNTRRRHSTKSSCNTSSTSTSSTLRNQKLILTDAAQQTFPISEVPRTSIAERFMSPNYNASVNKVNPNPASQDLNSVLSNTESILSNPPLSYTDANSTAQLSIASRFTNNVNKRSAYSTLPAQSIAPSEDPGPRRVTIADIFMRSSPIPLPATTTSKSHAASFADELDLGMIDSPSRSVSSRKPSQVHPLDTRQSTPVLFKEIETETPSLDLDLSLPPVTPSSENRTNRPWGSQDTLVHLQLKERKKSIYEQFMDPEKHPSLTSSPYSLDECYVDTTGENAKKVEKENEGCEYQLSIYDDYEDVEMNYNNPKCENDKWDEEKCVSNEERQDTPKARNTKQKQNVIDEPMKGVWVGCCFISCNSKRSHKVADRQRHRERETSPAKRRICGRRGWVFCTFLSLIVTVLAIYFLWPRTPLMRIEGASLTSPARITETKQGMLVSNVAFGSEWLVNITVDNRQNRIPTQITRIQIVAKDALTGLTIGKGVHNDDTNPEKIILAPSSIQTIQVPIRIDYQARETTDTTFVDLCRACVPGHTVPYNVPESSKTNQRESLPLHFWISLHLFGLDWLGYKPTVIATPATGGFACPQS